MAYGKLAKIKERKNAMRKVTAVYKCRWCGAIVKQIVYGVELDEDINSIARRSQELEPIIVHECHPPESNGYLTGICDLQGVRSDDVGLCP